MKTMMTEREAKESALVVLITMSLAIILALVAVFFFSKPAHGEETKAVSGNFIVSGYGTGEFAIKGDPEKTLNEGIAEVSTRMKSISRDIQLQFVVVGSADIVGSSVGNDELAAKRAKQVEAVLSANFPDAKIAFWSKGDAENIKQVRVEYKIIPTPVPVPAPVPVAPAPVVVEKIVERETKSPPYFVFALFVVAIIFLFVVSRTKTNKNKRATETTLEVDGYKVKVGMNGKFYHSPFTSRSGGQITRDSKKGIIDSLKGCLRGEEFEEQKQNLIKKGVIVRQ